MEYWFTEEHSDNVRFSIRTNKQLASVETEIQRVDVFDTPEFGKILVMDGNVTMTERLRLMKQLWISVRNILKRHRTRSMILELKYTLRMVCVLYDQIRRYMILF